MSEDFKGAFRKDNPLGGSIIPVRVITLEEAAKFLSGGTPSKSEPEYWTGNIPWVSAKDMKTLLISDTEDHITSEGAAVGSKIAPVGSILILVRGMTLLFDVPICYANRELTFNQDVKALVPRDGVDPRYLMYALLAAKPQLLDHVDQAGHGTGRLATDLLKSLEIRLPDIREQRRIAHVLGTLDDKIELNRRMNATLEAMARALFRSWFVDFDPVREKAEGRQPASMDEAMAVLFPDEFEESELGEIPKGWDVASLDEIANFFNGLALQNFRPQDGEEWLPVIKIAQLKQETTSDCERASASIKPDCIINDGDIIFSWSGSLEVVIWCGGKGALNQHLFKVTSSSFPKWFYYEWLLFHLDDFRATAQNKATTMGHIQRHHLTDAKVLIPTTELLYLMSKTMDSLIEEIITLKVQSRTLAALRDALLPKLMSGEILVKNLSG